MSFLARLINRVYPKRLERDLQDEIAFHIEMRANQHQRAGLNADEATDRARQQFGDARAVTMEMRQARLSSVTTLVTVTTLIVSLAVFWIAQQRWGSTDLRVPIPPAAPQMRDHDLHSASPPPPPPPPPTWAEYVAKAGAHQPQAPRKIRK